MEKVLLLIIIPLLLAIYFELVGRLIVNSICKTKLQIYFPVGLLCVLGIIYPTSLLINYCASFYILLVIYLFLFVLSIYLMIRKIDCIDKSINYVGFIVAIVICIVLTYYSYNTTLGNLNGFDSVHYLNMVSQNIGINRLNSRDIYLNTIPAEFPMMYYTNEVYYYFAGVILFCVSKIFTLLKINMYYGVGFVWIFQILFNFTIGSIIFESFKRIKCKIGFLACSIPIIFVFAKLYYNNAFGFYGNSWYTLALAYIMLFIFDYFDNQENNRYIIYLLLLGMCSLTSSGIYTSIFILFGLFFFSKNENCIKEYSIVLLIPIFNALFMERKPLIMNIFVPLGLAVLCFVAGNYIYKFLNKNNRKKYFLLLCILLLFFLSRKYSNGLFDFTGIFNNLSQRQDMSLNYFDIKNDIFIISFYKVFVLALLLLSIIINHKKKYIMFFFIIIITFFNPFNCNFINRYISVYYRAYSIFFNPFILYIMFDELMVIINNKYINYGISFLIAIVLFLNIDFVNPIIYHYQFKPVDGYNGFYKMNDDEIDIINQLKDNIYYYKDDNPYIITNNLLTMSMLPQGKYLYGKSKYQSANWSESEKELYAIFYQPEYLGDHIKKDPDYNDMLKYINDANVNYLVVDKTIEYYDTDISLYSYLYLKVNEVCSIYPVYENNSFVLYRFS